MVVVMTTSSRTRRRTAIGIAAGTLVIGAALGVADVASAQPTPTPTPGTPPGAGGSATPGPGPGFRPGPLGHRDQGGGLAKQLADKLGVDQTKVSDALRSVWQARRPTNLPSPGSAPGIRDRAADDAALAKALAGPLGVDEAKVKIALDAIRQAHQADRAQALQTRLDAAVKAGTLTQAEADAVRKAVAVGVVPFGPR